MMTAYNELYLDDAMHNLGDMLEYAVDESKKNDGIQEVINYLISNVLSALTVKVRSPVIFA